MIHLDTLFFNFLQLDKKSLLLLFITKLNTT